jgi:2-methylcitrate dehydratase PrpD
MSTPITSAVADFVHGTGYESLPHEVIEYTKMVILDSIICGVAAGNLERTRMMQEVIKKLGGPPDATVFGLKERVNAMNAAMANAESMQLLDADDTFFSSNHFAVLSVAAGLAEAQRLGKSGRDLIRAVALGFDINARINLAMRWIDFIDGEFKWASVGGMGWSAMGAAVSAGVVAGLDRTQIRNLLGLVSWTAPTAVNMFMNSRSEFSSMKYGNYGGAAQSGMLANLLAQVGYVSDEGVLDLDPGFMDAQGSVSVDSGLLTDRIGEKWWILETSLKYYPSCRYTHGPIDMLKRLMEDEGIEASDISKIEIKLNPMAYALPFFRSPQERIETDHRAPLHGAFNIPYVMALVALGRRPGPGWYSLENLEDPEVWDFASRITTSVDEAAADEVMRAIRETRIRRFRKSRGALAVVARGRQFDLESEYCAGDPWTEETRPTWERLTEKFDDFCADFVPRHEIERLVGAVRSLEGIGDVSADLALP